jgi:DNA-binding beta-propeller fold protein YncE
MRTAHALFVLLLLLLCIGAAANPAIYTVAGSGRAGFSGDGGSADKAELNQPFGLTRGPDGALYVCDCMNHVIRRIDGKTNVITTVAGTPTKKGYAGDGGPATAALLNEPYEVRFDPAGNMYFVERMNHCVRRVDAKSGVISTIAGDGRAGFAGDGGPAAKARFNQPHSIQLSPGGSSLFVCDILNHRVRRIDMKTLTIDTFAGTGQKQPTPDGAPVAGTPVSGPRAIDFDSAGDLWLALREGNRVYRFDMKTLTYHHVAGTGKNGFAGNGGPAKEATLSGPKGLAIDPRTGDVYLADTESHSVRRIDPKTGALELVAGTGQKGDGPDGDPLKCRMARPHGIFVDADGTVIVGDSENHRVRMIRFAKPAAGQE